MPESLALTLSSGKIITVPIRRSSRAKRLRMTHSSRGNFTLTAPVPLSMEQIRYLSQQFVSWMERLEATRQNLPVLPLVPDMVQIPFLGLEYGTVKRASLAEGRRRANNDSAIHNRGGQRVLINFEGDILAFYGSVEDEELLAESLRVCMRGLAARCLPPRLVALAKKGNYGEIKIIVRDQKGRWGSCTRRAGRALPTISLNWRGLLLSPDLFDHLCWHELAHLRCMGHTPQFHAELVAHSPQSRQNEKALNTAWRNLPAWALPG